MKIGIVGAEAAKFTRKGEAQARAMIRWLIDQNNPELVISGGCHLGGIDSWAIQEARARGIRTRICLPARRSWKHYRKRNARIAAGSDAVYSITVDALPRGFRGMRFDLCYHCNSRDHVKSGGCWTAKYARKLGKTGITKTVRNV